MEIMVLLIVVVLFYVLPEILRRRRKKDYKYPDIPAKVHIPKMEQVNINTSVETQMQAEATEIPAGQSDLPAWQGKLEHTALVNGMIFAEILQPPRAMRPLWPRFLKRS